MSEYPENVSTDVHATPIILNATVLNMEHANLNINLSTLKAIIGIVRLLINA